MIRAEALTKTYGSLKAVDALSFEVAEGETFALIGPNGAGKTTTLRILLGLSRPDAGRIAIGRDGLAPGDPATRRDLGYVPQRVEFPHGRTVAEVLRFFADLRGLGGAEVERALRRARLDALAGRRASELSGGYTQRLSLAQALLADPALLVLDEPTASLDPEATWEFRSLVEQLQREGKTILLCSHLLSEVERIADRVLILVDGRCGALERMDDLRERQARATRLVVETVDDACAAIAALEHAGFRAEPLGDGAPRTGGTARCGLAVDANHRHAIAALETLRAAGIAVRTFELQRPTLEEIFLDVVRGPARAR
jgi:ABC-type multidrug transport system ATPase subunit